MSNDNSSVRKQTKIDSTVLLRLTAQGEEAFLQGNVKLASAVAIATTNLKSEDSWNTEQFSVEQMRQELKNNLWKATVSLSRFYGASPDIQEMDIILDEIATELETAFKKLTKASDLGANEPPVIGEVKNFEVED